MVAIDYNYARMNQDKIFPCTAENTQNTQKNEKIKRSSPDLLLDKNRSLLLCSFKL